MHTIWSRANAIFAFTLTAMSAVTFAVFLSTIYSNRIAPVTISAANPRVRVMPDYISESGKISEAKFVDPQTLTFMMNSNSQSFSPWFRLLYEQGWIEKWWKNLDNLTKFSNPSKITKLNE
uniref:Uncharacterized protein n=1 Tax=Panagrolaimus sp. JU765 TaxID=591449 RepID=A0AC34R840_9BILA